MVKLGTQIRYKSIGVRSLNGKGVLEKIYKNFILIDAGNYKITINKGDVIAKDTIIQVKINKQWVYLTREMIGF